MHQRLAEYVQIRKRRAAAGDDHRAARRAGDGRAAPRRGRRRHGHPADRRRLRHHHVAARRQPRLARRATTIDRARLVDDADLLNLATEEFLRHFTPAQGGGRTITQDCEVAGFEFSEGDRVFLSYAMCNHDPSVFPDPDDIVLDRFPNPHAAFGLGVHRCIGSNLARLGFKHMLREVLRRMPDYRVDRAGRVQYESIGVINGYQHLPATFTPGEREGPPLAEVMGTWQARLDAEPAPDGRVRVEDETPQWQRTRARLVDPELCQGHTLCNMVAPDIFHLRDEDGHAYVVVDELTPEQEALAQKAAVGCPERAITVTE